MTHNSTDAAGDPWRDSLEQSRERRATTARARRWMLRRRGVAATACAVMAVGGGAALAAGNGGAGADSAGQSDSAPTTLHPGDSGPAVARLQSKLGIASDGQYGSITKRAVKRFQRRHGLNADGVAGPATLSALGVTVAAASTSSASSTSVPAVLQRIAQCESGGNIRAVSSGGTYRGKYQFDRGTWQAYGGQGDPIDAPEGEQDRVAVQLYRARGTAPWGACAS